MSDTQSSPANCAATRAADVLLRAAGGRSVLLRLPAPAVPADPTEQLGLATPQFQDVPLAPVAFRKARAVTTPGEAARWELMVSASAVAAAIGSAGNTTASAFFASAFGVLCDDELLEIISATEEQVFGKAYVYRLLLRAPQAQIV